jgi:alkanesulfonate monooxygenase SsuD/methylene tetrahydromethanopterin reductase-like flavin-dependent oxidoreductase (luciferase family)
VGDYGRKLECGVSVEPLADPPDYVSRIVRAAERAGLDLVGIQDHPYQRRFLDTWTLISTLVPVTEHIRFFPDVANLPVRPPAMLAKAAASLDVLSGGRIEMGLGAGAFWEAVVAMDGPRKSPGEAVRATEEAIQVMRLVWSEERSLRFDGEFYSLRGMRPGPRPVHEIGIWVGAYGPRMLRLIREARRWLGPVARLLFTGEAARDAGADRRGGGWGRAGARGDSTRLQCRWQDP